MTRRADGAYPQRSVMEAQRSQCIQPAAKWIVGIFQQTHRTRSGPVTIFMIISRTPFRISFFGGGTDYPGWYMTNGGEVLVTSINKYCYLTCRRLPPFFPHRFRIVYVRSEN